MTQLVWEAADTALANSALGDSLLVVRADGKGYFGKLHSVQRDYFELASGSQRQIIRFFGPPTWVARITVPSVAAPVMGQPKLALGD